MSVNLSKENKTVNATVENGKEVKKMAENTPITVEYDTEQGHRVVDAVMYYNDNGYLCGAPTIDGQIRENLMVGGCNEADVKAGLALELKMIEMANGSIYDGMALLQKSMKASLYGIKPTEQVTVDAGGYGLVVMIDYNTKKAYDETMREVANLDDLACKLPDEAVKALLVERVKTALQEEALEVADGNYDEPCEGCDGECEGCEYADEWGEW